MSQMRQNKCEIFALILSIYSPLKLIINRKMTEFLLFQILRGKFCDKKHVKYSCIQTNVLPPKYTMCSLGWPSKKIGWITGIYIYKYMKFAVFSCEPLIVYVRHGQRMPLQQYILAAHCYATFRHVKYWENSK